LLDHRPSVQLDRTERHRSSLHRSSLNRVHYSTPGSHLGRTWRSGLTVVVVSIAPDEDSISPGVARGFDHGAPDATIRGWIGRDGCAARAAYGGHAARAAAAWEHRAGDTSRLTRQAPAGAKCALSASCLGAGREPGRHKPPAGSSTAGKA